MFLYLFCSQTTVKTKFDKIVLEAMVNVDCLKAKIPDFQFSWKDENQDIFYNL